MEAGTPGPYATGLTVEARKARVERALAVERFLFRLGWLILALAVAGLVTVLALCFTGQIDIDQTLGGLLGVVMSSVLSGAATYGSGSNVGLGAAKLAVNLPPEGEAAGAD